MSNSKKPVRETPIRSFGESEWDEDFYRRYSLDGESLEHCKARVNKEMRASRKAAIHLLSEKNRVRIPGTFGRREIKEPSFVSGSVTMDFLIENDFTQEKPLNVVISRIGKPAIKGRVHIIIAPKTENGCRKIVVRSEPCLIDAGYVYFVLMPVNVKDDSVICVESNVLDDLIRMYTVPEDQTFEVTFVPDYHHEAPVRSNVIHEFLQQQVDRRIAVKEELRANGELEPFEMEGRPVPKELFFGSQLFDKLPTPELVQRINDMCSDKPTVVVTPRRPHTPSFFAGSVAMSNEVDFMLSINKEQGRGDTQLTIHQPKKRPEGLQGVQLKQSPKNVFVQLGNGAVYWAANHHHAQTIHRIITAETKQMYAKCYKTWKDNV